MTQANIYISYRAAHLSEDGETHELWPHGEKDARSEESEINWLPPKNYCHLFIHCIHLQHFVARFCFCICFGEDDDDDAKRQKSEQK